MVPLYQRLTVNIGTRSAVKVTVICQDNVTLGLLGNVNLTLQTSPLHIVGVFMEREVCFMALV